MAQEHLTPLGASQSRWVRALALACGAAWCIASVGCGHDEPGVLGPGLDPPKSTVDGGARPGGEFGNGANSGNGGKGGNGGQPVGGDDQVDDDGSGGSHDGASGDAGITPPSCPSGDAGIPSRDAGVPSGDAGAFEAGFGCDEDAGVAR